MKAEEFLKKHNAKRVEDLTHEQLLDFAQNCMDRYTAASIRRLLSGAYGEPPDPIPHETDKGIIQAYHQGKSMIACFVESESDDGGDYGEPGYIIYLNELT